jgi:hypothetical protein
MQDVGAYLFTITQDGSKVAPYMQAMYDHFESGTDLWELDDSILNHSSSGFIVKSKTLDNNFQMRFSEEPADDRRCTIGIDVNNEMTDPDDHQQGSSSLIWRNVFRRDTGNHGSAFFIIETKDSITYVRNNTTAVNSLGFWQAGKIMDPAGGNDHCYGMNGFGMLGPSFSNTNPVGNFSSIAISHGVIEDINLASQITPTPATSSVATAVGIIPPAYVVKLTSNNRLLGTLRYCRRWTNNLTHQQVISDEDTGQAFIALFSQPSGNPILLPWDKDITFPL